MKKRDYVYVVSKVDDKELPEFVADTLEELSAMTGFSLMCLYKACVRHSVIAGIYQVEKIDINTFDDVDSFEDYNTFCKRLMIKSSNPDSLELFRLYCMEDVNYGRKSCC